MPPFSTVLETNGCAMPSVNREHYSLNRPFEWVPTQNANNIEDPPTGRRMGVNRDFTAWEFWDWLHFPPAVFAKTRRPRSSYGRAYGRRVSAAAAIGKRSCHAHWGPDDTLTGPPIVLSTPCQMGNFVTASRRESDPLPPARCRGVQRDSSGPRSQNRPRPSGWELESLLRSLGQGATPNPIGRR